MLELRLLGQFEVRRDGASVLLVEDPWVSGASAQSAAAALKLAGARHVAVVEEEIERLKKSWESLESERTEEQLEQLLPAGQRDSIDLFDRIQLARVVEICRNSRSLSDAGRILFHSSRQKKTSTNDSDRLRKYLSRFGIRWEQIHR